MSTKPLIDKMLGKFGDRHRERIERGVSQVAAVWKDTDGMPDEMETFCLENFISDTEELGVLMTKFERNLDILDGHLLELYRKINEPLQLDWGPIEPIDVLFGEFNPFAHINDDLYSCKIAFAALLNFPLHSLSEKNRLGMDWSKEQWAQARLTDMFSGRVPSEIAKKASAASPRAHNYIADYNIFMDRIVVGGKEGLFPKGKKLISHWGLRDELKDLYKEADGLKKQEIIEKILNRIITQEIPREVINNPLLSWDPETNKVYDGQREIQGTPENGVRYEHLRQMFEADKMLDPYYPETPTAIDRNFQISLEIEEEKVRGLFESVLTAPVIGECAALIEKRLGRKLRAFDIWYGGFRDSSNVDIQELDEIVSSRYKTHEDFQKDIARMLETLGFRKELAVYLASKIEVDPSRGAGHAMGAGGREFKSHLRTRFAPEGMNYISFNVASHELGHCVEQVFSGNLIGSTLLSGVPNTAFTEAFAFVFQARDLELLGKKGEAEGLGRSLHSLWHCFELCGVAMLCIDTWHFMYRKNTPSAQEIQHFVTDKAKEIWNRYYAPILNEENSLLLASYSHLIDSGIYLPNYPIGEMIRCQIESHIAEYPLAESMEKMCLQGNLTPDIWLTKGMGSPLSSDFILANGAKALRKIKR